jgi:nucleotide-binding universal stress UspA family protein
MMSARPIIGAVDVDVPSPTAGDCARWLAVESGAPLELVYVFDPGSLPALGRIEPGVREKVYDLQDARVKARATERLAAITSASPGIRTSATIAEGVPVPTLRELAGDRRAGMIVAGTAAREGLEHVLQGSVAGELAANAPCPVTVVPPDADVAAPGPVLVGDDGSEHGRRAVGHATAIAARLGRDVVTMHVEEGDPVAVLSAAGRDRGACLIVSGTRGRGPLRAELFGSVSAGLVQRARRPVVLVSSSAAIPPSG